MSMTDKLWRAFSTAIKMNDKVVNLASMAVAQQAKIEELTARVIRLETALEIALTGSAAAIRRRLPRQSRER